MTPARFVKVELQLASWCNRSCSFCPSGTFPVAKEIMSAVVLERIVDELARSEFRGAVALHLMCEPLLYKRFEDLLRLFRKKLPRAYLYINTNGDPLVDYERLHRFFEAGLNLALINCYDSQTQFDRRNGELLRLARRHPDVWYWNQWLCDPAVARHQWRVVRLREFFGTGYTLQNWAGLVSTTRDEKLKFPLKLACDRVVTALHVNYRGQVLLCNHDWKFQVVAGDLMQQDLETVWASPVLEKYRTHLAQRDRSLLLCQNCDNGYPATRMPGFPPADRLARARHVWGGTRQFAARTASAITRAFGASTSAPTEH
jgi:MoaA/NifB/PqqE/SkfB family radical SAM enzyme